MTLGTINYKRNANKFITDSRLIVVDRDSTFPTPLTSVSQEGKRSSTNK